MPTPARREDGQAAAELVAALPAVLVVVALLWQVVLAGHAVWMTSSAARAAARASAVGSDVRRAAVTELPRSLRRGVRVRSLRDGGVRVSVAIPFVLGSVRLGRTSAESRFEPQA
jgi:hypothetical protein